MGGWQCCLFLFGLHTCYGVCSGGWFGVGFVFDLMLFVGYLLMLKGVCFGVYCWVFWCWADAYVWVCLDLVWASLFSWFVGVGGWCFSCDWRCCLHTVLGVVIGFARCYF